jgi:hypothetical protein
VHLFFGGDHVIRQDWFARDERAHIQRPQFYPRLTRDTSRRLHEYIDRYPTILLPSHDGGAAKNLAGMEPLKI